MSKYKNRKSKKEYLTSWSCGDCLMIKEYPKGLYCSVGKEKGGYRTKWIGNKIYCLDKVVIENGEFIFGDGYLLNEEIC